VFHAQLLGIHDEDASRNDNTAIATVTDTSSHFDSFCLFNNDGFNESNDYNSSSFFLFDEHYHRLNFELKYFDFPYQIDRPELLKNLNSALEGLDKSQPYKLRVTVNRSGDVKITAHHILNRSDLFDGLTINSIDEYISSGSTLWSVHIDKKPILISPFTSFKTTRRDHYSEARGRSLPAVIPEGEQHEVLLFNSANHVMEGSITNIAIRQFDEEKQEFDWVTPVLASGCLCGVVRHMLLSKGLIKEKLILLKDVKVGDEVLLMNGIIGVVKGRIVD
jgi:branched-subunit amino acid aminotransferase/4-amino-4-deoxychorismate lyase